MLSNVYTDNDNYLKLIQAVEKEQPDVLVLQEVNSSWIKALETLHTSYNYRSIKSREDNFGIAVFSKIEITKSEFVYAEQYGVPSFLGNFKTKSVSFNLISTHPLPPVSSSLYKRRNNQLQAIADLSSSIERPLILVGDLNVSMWSPDYKSFQKKSGLKNTRQGFGIIPSWPAFFPLAYIPIDHCLVSQDIKVENMKRIENIGSDHYPIVIDLIL